MRDKYDILVLGGGPAGFASAIPLAQAGLRVMVVDAKKTHIRKGDMLSPNAAPLLRALGCWEYYNPEAHLECPGIISSWGSAAPFEADFINNPNGMGWFIDRPGFEAMLERRFLACGGEVWKTSGRSFPDYQGRHDWSLSVEGKSIRADFLVYATGRGTLPGIANGKIPIDKQIAVLRAGTFPDGRADYDMRLQIEATEGGWWYLAFYPGGQVIQAYMTDPDLLPKGDERHYIFDRAALTAPHISRRIENCRFDRAPTVVSAGTFIRKQLAGADWLVVGDAAMGLDPLSGMGICYALKGGVQAAEHITQQFSGTQPDLQDYSLSQLERFHSFVESRKANYSNEQRWPEAPYWSRRVSFNKTSIHQL